MVYLKILPGIHLEELKKITEISINICNPTARIQVGSFQM
jgi:hypothetical protein